MDISGFQEYIDQFCVRIVEVPIGINLELEDEDTEVIRMQVQLHNQNLQGIFECLVFNPRKDANEGRIHRF